MNEKSEKETIIKSIIFINFYSLNPRKRKIIKPNFIGRTRFQNDSHFIVRNWLFIAATGQFGEALLWLGEPD